VVLRENRRAADRHHALAAKCLEDLLSCDFLDGGHLHRREKLAVGQLR